MTDREGLRLTRRGAGHCSAYAAGFDVGKYADDSEEGRNLSPADWDRFMAGRQDGKAARGSGPASGLGV